MIQKKFLVSIIMNCYNGDKFINKSIASILNQSYKNWELIFWDNNSNDDSAKIVKKYDDKRIKYYRSFTHEKLYKARNLAIQKSTGKFITFLDVDDTWDKNKLKIQVKKILNSKIDVIYSNHWIQKNNTRQLFKLKKKKYKNILSEIILDYSISILTVFMKSDIFKKKGYKFDNQFEIIGDFDFFFRISKSHKFEYISIPLATYNIHSDNLSKKKLLTEIKEFNFWIKKNKKILDKYQNNLIERNKIRMCEYLLSQNKLKFSSKEIFELKEKNLKYKFFAKIILKKLKII
tara:strand:+ start:843 stop:1712 length:870 start_codon:yes stop_codon:yes gene_type:complete